MAHSEILGGAHSLAGMRPCRFRILLRSILGGGLCPKQSRWLNYFAVCQSIIRSITTLHEAHLICYVAAGKLA
jgi:hypothetical protein